MLYHYYISRSWMVSTTAQSVYRWAARLAMLFFIVIVATPFLEDISGLLVSLYRAAFFAGLLGTGLLLVAMEYFLFSFDESSAMMKVLWFLLASAPPIGTAIYWKFGYSRSKTLDKPVSQRPEGMVEDFRGSK